MSDTIQVSREADALISHLTNFTMDHGGINASLRTPELVENFRNAISDAVVAFESGEPFARCASVALRAPFRRAGIHLNGNADALGAALAQEYEIQASKYEL